MIFCCKIFSVVCFHLAHRLFTSPRHMQFSWCAFPKKPNAESRPLFCLETVAPANALASPYAVHCTRNLLRNTSAWLYKNKSLQLPHSWNLMPHHQGFISLHHFSSTFKIDRSPNLSEMHIYRCVSLLLSSRQETWALLCVIHASKMLLLY